MREVRPIRCMHSPATSPLGQIRMARTHARSGQSHARSGRSHVRGRSVTCGCAQPRARRPAGCMFVICPAARTWAGRSHVRGLAGRPRARGCSAACACLAGRPRARGCSAACSWFGRPVACAWFGRPRSWSDRAHARGPTGRMLVVRPVACSWFDRSHARGPTDRMYVVAQPRARGPAGRMYAVCPAARAWADRSHVIAYVIACVRSASRARYVARSNQPHTQGSAFLLRPVVYMWLLSRARGPTGHMLGHMCGCAHVDCLSHVRARVGQPRARGPTSCMCARSRWPAASTRADRSHVCARALASREHVGRPVACMWADRSHVCGYSAART
jgi:hypothetical protein